ncbi:hypothetical protein ACTMQO_10400, partial [Escherichia coli]
MLTPGNGHAMFLQHLTQCHAAGTTMLLAPTGMTPGDPPPPHARPMPASKGMVPLASTGLEPDS